MEDTISRTYNACTNFKDLRVHFNLANGRRDLRVGHQVGEQLSAKVADTDVLGELESRQFLHGGPGFLHQGGLATLGNRLADDLRAKELGRARSCPRS
jgi:hypothetical protein